MKIKKMSYFVKGIIDILLSFLVVCVAIKTHYTIMLLCLGISEIVVSIETKTQRLRRNRRS